MDVSSPYSWSSADRRRPTGRWPRTGPRATGGAAGRRRPRSAARRPPGTARTVTRRPTRSPWLVGRRRPARPCPSAASVRPGRRSAAGVAGPPGAATRWCRCAVPLAGRGARRVRTGDGAGLGGQAGPVGALDRGGRRGRRRRSPSRCADAAAAPTVAGAPVARPRSRCPAGPMPPSPRRVGLGRTGTGPDHHDGGLGRRSLGRGGGGTVGGRRTRPVPAAASAAAVAPPLPSSSRRSLITLSGRKCSRCWRSTHRRRSTSCS